MFFVRFFDVCWFLDLGRNLLIHIYIYLYISLFNYYLLNFLDFSFWGGLGQVAGLGVGCWVGCRMVGQRVLVERSAVWLGGRVVGGSVVRSCVLGGVELGVRWLGWLLGGFVVL